MKTAIVGHTGFVGSNLAAQNRFDHCFNSGNIREAYGLRPDLLVYAGLRAEMFLANRDPLADLESVRTAAENIRRIAPRRVVLISTVAVYGSTIGRTEDTVMELGGLPAYGLDRYFLECYVRDNFKDSLVVRLPAIFGRNLKKNFLYDFIHVVPRMLKPGKYGELSHRPQIRDAYVLQDNGFYVCRDLGTDERGALKQAFVEEGFTAVSFTDSRSRYQFYNLAHLWEHITAALENGIRKINLVTEPVEVGELYRYLTGHEFQNHLPAVPYDYDLRTLHDGLFGGHDGYIYDKGHMLAEIRDYVREETAHAEC